jgi:steroid delta-isomerase-like uncharacterized protein
MTNEELLRTACRVIWTEGDTDRIEEFYAEDFQSHVSPVGPSWGSGLRDLKTLADQLRSAFPDYRESIEDLICDGDRVMVRLTIKGTHNGALGGVPATGREIEITDMSIFRIANGRIAEQWALSDYMSLYLQLGLIELPVA